MKQQNDPLAGLDEFEATPDDMAWGPRVVEREPTPEEEREPYTPHFKVTLWRDFGKAQVRHEWLVRNLLSRGELSMLAGASQSGKTFLTLELAMAICRGIPFLGHPVMTPGGVVYQAGEGYAGLFDKRIPAYRLRHGLADADDLPFALIGSPINLFASDDDTDKLIDDIGYATSLMSVALQLIVIDTLAAALPGANENASEDVSRALKRCDRIRLATGANVLLVHHMNAEGNKARGWTGFTANVETVLMTRLLPDMQDAHGRKLREMEIHKQKDGVTEIRPTRFVLSAITVRQDIDGNDETSCTVDVPATSYMAPVERPSPKGIDLSPQAKLMLECIERAVLKHPEPPPADVDLPPGMGGTLDPHVRRIFDARMGDGGKEDAKTRQARVRKAWERQSEKLQTEGLIEIWHKYIWRTKKGLRGSLWDPERDTERAEIVTVSRADDSSGPSAGDDVDIGF